MPSCELCGRSMKGRGRSAIIEGASMIVCPQCASKFAGHNLTETKHKQSGPKVPPAWVDRGSTHTESSRLAPVSKRKPKPKRRQAGILLDDMEIIENYAEVIREARQKMRISQEELAQRVGERVSTLQSIEGGRQKPTEKTLRGLERELEISLLEAVGPVPLGTKKESDRPTAPTLGDRVVVKRKIPQKSRRTDTQTK